MIEGPATVLQRYSAHVTFILGNKVCQDLWSGYMVMKMRTVPFSSNPTGGYGNSSSWVLAIIKKVRILKIEFICWTVESFTVQGRILTGNQKLLACLAFPSSTHACDAFQQRVKIYWKLESLVGKWNQGSGRWDPLTIMARYETGSIGKLFRRSCSWNQDSKGRLHFACHMHKHIKKANWQEHSIDIVAQIAINKQKRDDLMEVVIKYIKADLFPKVKFLWWPKSWFYSGKKDLLRLQEKVQRSASNYRRSRSCRSEPCYTWRHDAMTKHI